MATFSEDAKTSVPVTANHVSGPEWVIAEMPPGYGNRVVEIQRLTAELQSMSRFARLLYEVGPPLAEAALDTFASLGFEAEPIPGEVLTGVSVRLDRFNRLLVHVASGDQPIQKKSAEVPHVFRLLHELADDHDHVVFVTNGESATPPADRGDAVSPEALNFLSRMGVSHVPASTLFALWKLSLQEPDRARREVQRLHAHDGGTFQLSPFAILP